MKIGHQWVRVFGPNLQPQHKERGKKNEKIFKSKKFLDACESVGIKPTRRQASKFRKGMGLAYSWFSA